MSIDQSKLTPAEAWRPDNWDAVTLEWLRSPAGKSDRDFIKLARNFADVAQRRGWGMVCRTGIFAPGWAITFRDLDPSNRVNDLHERRWPDLISCMEGIVEADAALTQEEKR